jgi:site-specific DNA-methyltransferase (adenine-specific)
VVTDPPYGLSFMGKKWDYDVPSVEFWKEVYRVLKPGGHVLSFGGTRTYHRMVVNIEDAGFEIRDQIMWLYGSGFPKSHNIGKAIDATIKTGKSNPKSINQSEMSKEDGEVVDVIQPNNGILGDKKLVTKNVGASLETKEAQQWEGWGTSMKPSVEPICVARKPLSEKSVAENVLKWGTGGINIDGCRVGFDMSDKNPATNPLYRHQNADKYKQVTDGGQKVGENVSFTNSMNPPSEEGRFPANIILECLCDEVIKGEKGEVRKSGFRVGGKSEYSVGLNGVKNAPDNYGDKGDIHTNPMCPCYIMDEQSGNIKSTGSIRKKENEYEGTSYKGKNELGKSSNPYAGQSGGSSRFFYQAKVSKSERNMGLDGFEEKVIQGRDAGQDERAVAFKKRPTPTKNVHPTIKPVNLMAYLCRLITPPNGIVLDPFMGSGSTGISALLEGFRFVGMEMDADYFKIAEERINNYESYRKFIKK